MINRITIEDVNRFKNQYYDDNAMNLYQAIAGKSAIYPGQGTFLGLLYVNTKLQGEAGEFSENVGKALRDDNILDDEYPGEFSDVEVPTFRFGEIRPERRLKLKRELGDVLWYVARAAAELGFNLSEIAEENLIKLHDRTKRGTLQGSGDER